MTRREDEIMPKSKYLIIGSSHAGLSAMDAIRMRDVEGSITIISREKCLPYSPTILPYVVSGEVDPQAIFLRDQAFFNNNNVHFMNGCEVKSLDAAARKVILDSGEEVEYEKVLIASGASPELPSITSLNTIPSYVLRTIEDALKIRAASVSSPSAIILGGGLIGMHAAENLAKAGLEVTLVEMQPQVLPGYFDEQAAAMIQKVFTDNGVRVLTGHAVTHVTASNSACVVSLENGLDLSGHVLLVATGVKPNTGFVKGSEIDLDKGVLVDDRMRTSASHVWAAGDVAQASSFAVSEKILNGILPDAVEQGWIAGMDMVEDPALQPYRGGMPMNTYSFFGNHAFTVGITLPPERAEEYQVDLMVSPSGLQYQKFVFKDDSLLGVSAINADLDPGVLSEMIFGRISLDAAKARLARAPRDTGRLIMSGMWR